jgi:hypothetical protein
LPAIPITNFLTILGTHGTNITWYSKTTGSDNPYDTGSQISFGYGDAPVILNSGSFNAVVIKKSAEEELIESGFYEEVQYWLYYSPSSAPDYYDYAVFNNRTWLVLPFQERIDANRSIFVRAGVRELIPSGSNEILVNYLRQSAP